MSERLAAGPKVTIQLEMTQNGSPTDDTNEDSRPDADRRKGTLIEVARLLYEQLPAGS